MGDLSIITSLYKSDKFLPDYVDRVAPVLNSLARAGICTELVIVANDPSENERQHLNTLSHRHDVKTIYTDRESLYASWNRGLAQSTGQVIGMWNVDDLRTAEALIDGVQRIQAGSELVYFRWRRRELIPWLFNIQVVHYSPVVSPPFDRELFQEYFYLGPFFLFSRKAFEQVGPFDPRFSASGDFDWSIRASQHIDFYQSDCFAGEFFIHHNNLSENDYSYLEDNAVFLKNGLYQFVKAAEPSRMREVWSKWADDYPLPTSVTDKLWGDHAWETWETWKKAHARKTRKKRRSHLIRMVPRMIIDKCGLRQTLYRLNIVKSERPYTTQ